MAIALRLLTAFAGVLSPGGVALAQPATAPPPHLALDEFVREYQRFGLPLPPPNAEFVRLRWTPDTPPCLGFQLPPAKSSNNPQHLIGVKTYQYPPGQPVKTSVDALRDVEPEWVVEMLCVAAQCRARGLNDIAAALYARGLEATANPVPPRWRTTYGMFGSVKVRDNGWKLHIEGDDVRSAHLELRHAAFAYWHAKIMEPGIDRREVLRYLHAVDLGFHADVRDLERTVAPRKSKPGTVEALIDDLTEWRTWDNIIIGMPDYTVEPHPGEAAYWKLAEKGFDAIPALLDHLHDSRFTRHPAGDHDYTGFEWELFRPTHVGQLARYLVCGFAGDYVIGMYPDTRDDDARAWWEKARKVGEEKWLLDHALPEVKADDIFSRHRPNRVIFRALGAKYPARLAEVYRTLLREPRGRNEWQLERESYTLCLEIKASKLPQAEKLALLEEGTAHKEVGHRIAALTVLMSVDRVAFRKRLIATLQWLPPARNDDSYLYCVEGDLVTLVEKAQDPACWDALTAAARRVSVGLRLELIRRIGEPARPVDDAAKQAQVRFLVGFLADESTPPRRKNEADPSRDVPAVQVRDFTAEVLANELGVWVTSNEDRGALSRLIIRAVASHLAMRALAAKK